jgi:tyrosine-protein phosphatase YwqE
MRNKLWLKNWIFQSLEKRNIDFIASDAHDIVFRKPLLSEAYEIIKRKISKEIANEVFYFNAQKIIDSVAKNTSEGFPRRDTNGHKGYGFEELKY